MRNYNSEISHILLKSGHQIRDGIPDHIEDM